MIGLFRILADGAELPPAVNDRVLSIRITDNLEGENENAEEDIDGLEIELDDRDFRITLPPPDAELTVFLAGVRMGTFVGPEFSGSGAPDRVRISAKAGDMRAGFKAPKSRSWEGKTFGDIVRTIAGEHALSPTVSPDVDGEGFGYLAQRGESDLHFLTRIGREIDAVVKPADRRLLVTKRGNGKDATGAELQPIRLGRSDHVDYDWETNGRVRFGKVTARWGDIDGGQTRTVTEGTEEPARELRRTYPNEVEARRAAKAALDRAKRASGTFAGRLSRFAPDLFAGGLIELPDMKPELSGRWHLTRVGHVLDSSGLRSDYNAERDNEEEDGDA